MRILVIDNDCSFTGFVKDVLELENYTVKIAYSGEEGEDLAGKSQFDLIILDILLPGENGIEACRRFRRNHITTPVIMVSGVKMDEVDVIDGLNCGADDYLCKPFSATMLVARVQACLRRGQVNTESRLTVGDLILNPGTRQVQYKKRSIKLTGCEYSILEYMMRHTNQIVSREILEGCTGNLNRNIGSNLIDVYIHRLRVKFKESAGTPILTINGAGYLMKA